MTVPSRDRGVLLAPGELFAHDFRVVRVLAQGGMGTVYLVEQLSTGKARALKLMHARFLVDAKARERFTQEARIGAHLESEHVVDVIAAGVEVDSDTPWLVMELLDGEDLGARIAREGALEPSLAYTIVQQVGHALAAAHDKGVVHRDLKPENVFIAKSRTVGSAFTVKILDFGIARVVQEDVRQSGTAAIGSPLWMAPEQTDRLPLTPAADTWSLGLLVFSMLTGRSYWKSGNYEDIRLSPLFTEILVTPLVPASERAQHLHARVPPGFDDWFALCLVRDPAARFAHARAALKALRADFSFVAGAPHELVSAERHPQTHDTLWDPKTVSNAPPVDARSYAPAPIQAWHETPNHSAIDHGSQRLPSPALSTAPPGDRGRAPASRAWKIALLAVATLFALASLFGLAMWLRPRETTTSIAAENKPNEELRAQAEAAARAATEAAASHREVNAVDAAVPMQEHVAASNVTHTHSHRVANPVAESNVWSGYLESRRVRFSARLRIGRNTGLGVLTLTVRQRRDPQFALAEGSEVVVSVRGTFAGNTLTLHVPESSGSDVQADTYVLVDQGGGSLRGRGQASANMLVLEL